MWLDRMLLHSYSVPGILFISSPRLRGVDPSWVKSVEKSVFSRALVFTTVVANFDVIFHTSHCTFGGETDRLNGSIVFSAMRFSAPRSTYRP